MFITGKIIFVKAKAILKSRKWEIILFALLVSSHIFPYIIGTSHFEGNRPNYTNDATAMLSGTKNFFEAYSPLYSGFLFLVLKLFGSYEMAYILQHIFALVIAMCFFYVVRGAFKSNFIAFFATAIAFLNSSSVALVHSMNREPLAELLLMLSFYFMVLCFRKKQLRWALLSGLALALCFLTRQEYLVVYFLILIFFIIFSVVEKYSLAQIIKGTFYYLAPVIVLSAILFSYRGKDIMPKQAIGNQADVCIFGAGSYALLPETFNYKSQKYSSILKRQQDSMKLFEQETGVKCVWPPPTLKIHTLFYQHKSLYNNIIADLAENKREISPSKIHTAIIFDTMLHNPFWYSLSMLNSLKLFLLSDVNEINLVTITPGFHADAQNTNPVYMDFIQKPLLSLVRLTHLPYFSKIFFPFFVLGLFIGYGYSKKNKQAHYFYIWSIIFILACFMGILPFLLADERYRFIFGPFIFLIIALGFCWFYEKLTMYLITSFPSYPKTTIKWVISCLLLIVYALGYPLLAKTTPKIFYNTGNRYYWFGTGPITGWADIMGIFGAEKPADKRKRLLQTALNIIPGDTLPKEFFPLTNPSFESWPAGKLPAGWFNAETGIGGGVFRETNMKNVKFGTFSVRLAKSSIGMSQLYYPIKTDVLKKLRGKTVLFGVWAKSANTAPNKVYLLITGNPAEGFYQNTGQWEFIYGWYRIPADAESINLYVSIDSDITADVYLDGAIMAR